MSEAAKHPEATSDTEIASLLAFAPVPRKQPRQDGWTAERQRAFIAILAATGDREGAAQAVGLTGRGAYDLRKCAGAEQFAEAWDDALALHESRRRRELPQARPDRARPGADRAEKADPEREPTQEEMEAVVTPVVEKLLDDYLLRLKMEREARVAGRVIAADFYARQLLSMEVAITRGGMTARVLEALSRKPPHGQHIIATPLSLLVDAARRAYWAEADDLDRPPMPELGYINDRQEASGLPGEDEFQGYCDGPYDEARRRREKEIALAAEAQRLWEEKARADALAWRQRIAAAGGEPDKVVRLPEDCEED